MFRVLIVPDAHFAGNLLRISFAFEKAFVTNMEDVNFEKFSRKFQVNFTIESYFVFKSFVDFSEILWNFFNNNANFYGLLDSRFLSRLHIIKIFIYFLCKTGKLVIN